MKLAMDQALYLSPMIPTFNLKETISFFSDVLEFESVMETESYCIMAKDHLTVHLLRAGAEIGQMEFYLQVQNIDQVWNSIKDKIQDLKHKVPFDQEYGMREIHIAVPQTNTLMFIGSEIGSSAPKQ